MKTRILALGVLAFFSLNSVFADLSVPQIVPTCVSPPSGLISWWPGEGNANDVVGTNNGTLLNGVTFGGGRVGQAFHLDGTNQYVEIADSPSLKPTNVSVEAWVKLDTLVTPGANIPGQQIIVFKKNTRSGNFEGYVLLKDRVNGRDCFSFAIASAGGLQIHALSSTVPQVGAWYHLVGTYDGATVRLYVNGVLEGSAFAGFPLDYGTRPVFFGRTGEFWVANFGGSMDEVSIYNRALTAGEILSLYNAGSAGKCTSPSCVQPPSGLISWWPGEGNANDVVGTNNGALVDGVTFAGGRVGQAFHLNGTNQYVQIPDSPSLKPTNVSVEAWVKLDTLVTPGANIPGQQIIVFKKNTRSGNFEGYVLLKDRVNGQDCFSFAIASAGGLQVHALSTTVPQVGTWYHLVGTYDGATVRMYVNGVLEGTAFAGFPLDYGTRPVFFGRTGEFWVANFGGSIDEVSLYNRALTAEEIQSLFDAGAAGKCTSSCVPPPSDLVSWWPAEGNGNDIVGTNNGIVSGNLSYASGEVGQAFVFNDGTADVRVPASTSINVGLGNGFTVEAWISPTTLAPQPVFEWNSGTGYDDIGAHLWISGGPSGPGPAGNLYANVRDNVGVSHFIMSAGGVVVSNHLQHVALTYDKASGIAVLYRNGVAVQTQTLGVFTPKTDYDLHLGRRIGGYYSGAYYLGSIDEASLYKRALSASEIQAIYNAGAAGKCAPLVAPIILIQPQGQTVNAGDTATFSVVAGGTLPLSYQWFLNSNALAGANSTTLTLTNTQPNQGGWYSVVVSNAAGIAVSSNALLHVNQIPVADASATVTRVFVCTCTDTNTTVVLNGTRSYDLDGDPLQYLWFEDGMNAPLATGAVAVVRLPPGTYPIDLVVSDGLAADTNVVVVKVLTAAGAIGDLIALIDSSDIAHPQPLIASLSAASDSVTRCDLIAAVNQLGAFQNKVLAQIAPDDSALAGVLIASAQEIIDSLNNCGGFQGQKYGKIIADHGQPGNKVHLKFEGNRGQSYIIEASSDLAHWEKIGVATDLHSGNFEFDDNKSEGVPVRFYRVVTP